MSALRRTDRAAVLRVAGVPVPVRVRLAEVTSTRDLRKGVEGLVFVLDPDADVPLDGKVSLTYEDGTEELIRVTGHQQYHAVSAEPPSELILRFIGEQNWSRRNPS